MSVKRKRESKSSNAEKIELTMPEGSLTFYSRSSTEEGRYLSNFFPCSIFCDTPFGTLSFPSIEHAFQAFKWLHLTTGMDEKHFRSFTAEAEIGKQTAVKAKSASGQAAMRRAGVTLNTTEWNKVQVDLMTKLVRSRAKSDPIYSRLLKQASTKKVQLLHIEQRKKASECFWGGNEASGQFQGQNKLGVIMMQVADELTTTTTSSSE